VQEEVHKFHKVLRLLIRSCVVHSGDFMPRISDGRGAIEGRHILARASWSKARVRSPTNRVSEDLKLTSSRNPRPAGFRTKDNQPSQNITSEAGWNWQLHDVRWPPI